MATMNAITECGGEGREMNNSPAANETLANRGLPLAGMGGAVVGGLAGAGLGAEFAVAFPVIAGGLGTILGSLFIAGGWCALATLAGFSATPHNSLS